MITLVVVNYRTAALAAEAIASARRAVSCALEVIVVENTLSPHEAAVLEPLCDRLLRPETNLGYGAGVNAAVQVAKGEIVIASNPDVVFGDRSLDLLAAAIRSGSAVAGPAFFWDPAYRWQLPPADLHGASGKVDEVLATRSAWWRRRRDRRRTRRRIAFWREAATVDVPRLSGAVLAFDRSGFNRHDGFDERFFLYFEETDLLRRVQRGRGRITYVPEARVRHLYNQSAGHAAESGTIFGRSERLYHDKWHERWLTGVQRMARPVQSRNLRRADGLEAKVDGTLIEVSPLPWFDAAAGAFVPRGFATLPREVLDTVGDAPLYMRSVEPETCVIVEEIQCRG